MDNRLLQLKQEVAELMQWKRNQEAVQVSYPLDPISKDIIQKELLVFSGKVGEIMSGNIWLEVESNGRLFWLSSQEI